MISILVDRFIANVSNHFVGEVNVGTIHGCWNDGIVERSQERGGIRADGWIGEPWGVDSEIQPTGLNYFHKF